MPLSIGERFGPYEILAPLGAGGMGEVYRAKDTKLDREVAVKVMPAALAQDAERLARFEREAKVLASLNHPNIAQIYGVEDTGAVRALIMELVPGEPLKGPLPIDTAINYARQVADALEAAHDRGIVHRDLKPANIMVTPAGVVKVLDFGLALIAQGPAPTGADPTNSPTLTIATQAGMILGTAAYMSPEQARGKPVDKRADIWAFGVVLYEMLTGRELFGGGETIADTLASVVKDTPDLNALPPGTPAHVRRLVDRCLRRDVSTRLRDIGEARIALTEGGSANAEAVAPDPRGIPRLWGALSAALVIALAGLSVVHFRESPPVAETVRFQIATTLEGGTGAGDTISLSPDGRRLAFVATQGGKTSLWVQSFNSVVARELSGTEGASNPFWSPDGRFLGFFATRKLKKIDLAGGPPVDVCDVPAVVGGSWSREGVIIFGTNRSGLFRVSQAGGVATPLTTPDPSRKEAYHSRPWFLPDGRRFIYVARSEDAALNAIYLTSLDGGERKLVLPASHAPAYAAPVPGTEIGHLLFLRDGTLMALPVNDRNLEPAGEAVPLAENVGHVISSAFFSISSTGVLAYRADGSKGESQVLWLDRDGRQTGSLGPVGVNRDVTLSPDGQRAAMSRGDDQRNFDLWIANTDGGVDSRFTFGPGPDRFPVWSPDGKTVAFSSARMPDGDNRSLYLKDAGGGGSEQILLKTDGNATALDWSGDGRFLLYGSPNKSGQSDLWALPMEGDRKPFAYLTTPFNERQGQFSPGSASAPRWIAYTSDESGRFEVYVQPFPMSSAGKFQISTKGGSSPRWRQDGKELYYIEPDGNLMTVDVRLAPAFQHGPPKKLFSTQISRSSLTDGSLMSFMYSPAADGKRFLIISLLQQASSVPVTVVLNWRAGVRTQ